MPIQLHFRLEFSSDWHVGAGHSVGLVADSAIQRDPDGIPVIEGSTLKGLFRDALHKLSGHSEWGKWLPNHVLGNPFEKSRWSFGPARPTSDADLPALEPAADFAEVIPGVRVNPNTRSAERGKLFQREMGSRELTFDFTIEGEGDQEDVEWLVAAARYIRRLGTRRRRGAGRCRISLLDTEGGTALQTALLKAFEQRRKGGTPEEICLPKRSSYYDPGQNAKITAQRLRVIIRTDSPVIIARKPEAGNVYESQIQIPGQTLRGALAARVQPAQLDSADYEEFLSLFVEGGIIFRDSLIGVLDDSGTRVSLVNDLPLGILKSPEGQITSALLSEHQDLRRYRTFQENAVLADGWMTEISGVRLSSRIHVHIDPDTQRASDGDLYTYETIPRGTYLIGEVLLQARTWPIIGRLLQVNLGQPFALTLGKATTRGYGLCTAWIEPLAEDEVSLFTQMPLDARLEALPDRVVVTLVSDTILLDPWGRAIQSFEEDWLSREFGLAANAFKIGRCAARSTVVDGFDTFSGLPRWRDVALAKGSSVVLLMNRPSAQLDRFARIERDGIGLRRNEGFGQVVFNHPWHLALNNGFVKPIALPDSLIRRRVSADGTEAFFVQRWKVILDEMLESARFVEGDRIASQYRTIARRLLERRPADYEGVRTLLAEMGEPGSEARTVYRLSTSYIANRQKENLFSRDALNAIESALHYLERSYPQHWQRGLVMLAEAILNAANQGVLSE